MRIQAAVFWQDLILEVKAFLQDYNEFQILAQKRPQLLEREMEAADSSGEWHKHSGHIRLPSSPLPHPLTTYKSLLIVGPA